MKEQNQLAQGILIALEMERRGMSLYNRAQKIVTDPSLLRILHELEQDERNHYRQFSEMAKEFDVGPMAQEEGELLLAQASTFFFPGGLMQAAMGGALNSPPALLGEAIAAEKDAIAFYSRLLELSGQASMRALEIIILEEKGHLAQLTERKNALM